MDKRTIDIQRDAPFHMQISKDGGEVKELQEINGHLYAICSNAIYEMLLPDNIDPERTNPNTKGLTKCVLDIGLDAPIVARILGQTFAFSQILSQENLHKITLKAFEIIPSIYQMADILISTYNELDEIIKNYNEKTKTEQFFSVDQIRNLESSTRTFLLEAHKVLKHVLELLNIASGNKDIKIFTELMENSQDENVVNIIKGYYQNTLDVIWNLRNSVEHNSAEQFIKINNITVSADNKIILPTWEHSYKSWDKKIIKTEKPFSLIGDMDVLFSNLQRLIEDTLLCFSLSAAYSIIPFEIETNEADEAKPRYSINYRFR